MSGEHSAATVQRDLRTGTPVWLRRGDVKVACAPLAESITVDVAVVGAGVSGALVVDAILRTCMSVAVLDRGLLALRHGDRLPARPDRRSRPALRLPRAPERLPARQRAEPSRAEAGGGLPIRTRTCSLFRTRHVAKRAHGIACKVRRFRACAAKTGSRPGRGACRPGRPGAGEPRPPAWPVARRLGRWSGVITPSRSRAWVSAVSSWPMKTIPPTFPAVWIAAATTVVAAVGVVDRHGVRIVFERLPQQASSPILLIAPVQHSRNSGIGRFAQKTGAKPG